MPEALLLAELTQLGASPGYRIFIAFYFFPFQPHRIRNLVRV